MKFKYLILTLVLLVFNIWAVSSLFSDNSLSNKTIEDFKENTETIAYHSFVDEVDADTINIIYYKKDNAVFYAEKDEKIYNVINPEYDTFKKDMLEKTVEVKDFNALNIRINELNKTKVTLQVIFDLIIIIVGFTFFFICFDKFRKTKRKRSRHEPVMANINIKPIMQEKEKKEEDSTKYNFSDVAGLHEVKKDVECLVDFLKNKDKYIEAGAKLPKGVIFYGPPGTGKTLLAKAIAGEAGIPFHYMSGSDFVEMYVGVGAKRVRELFADAKKKTPCIIFIDEIDAIGGKRGHEDNNGEDRKTLNALLTEMDGFKTSESIIVIGATNRIEDLDPALVRPGRFSNKYCIPLPCSAKERLEVINLYKKGKKFAEDVDFEVLSKETIGFSPAAIESLLNEAAIISVQDKKKFIDKVSIDKAMIKTLLSGHIKENQEDRNKEELLTVAWHEAGHALVGKLKGKEIPKVTILSSTSGAGGVTFTTPKETGLHSVEDLKDEVQELYAGRIAETLMSTGAKVTTGASNDIERATDIIKSIVTSYGMSDEYGLLNLNKLKVGQDIIIDKEVKLAKEIEAETVALMKKHYEALKRIAHALMENETLYDRDLTRLINNEAEEKIEEKIVETVEA